MAFPRYTVRSTGVGTKYDAETIGGDGNGSFEYGLVGNAGRGGVGHGEDGQRVFMLLLDLILGLLRCRWSIVIVRRVVQDAHGM